MVRLSEHHGISGKTLGRVLGKFTKIRKELWAQKKRYGFLDLPSQSPRPLLTFAHQFKGKFRDVVFLGIGGSSLGAKALASGLLPSQGSRLRFFFLENVDPDEIASLNSIVDWKKTLLIAISKSGETLETLSTFFFLRKKVARKRQVVLTEKKPSTLFSLTVREKLPFFPLPRNVTGRFSVLSAAGLFPATLLNIDIQRLLRGASRANEKTAFRLAAIAYLLAKKKKNITVFFPYSERLSFLADWYLQLLAESLGKKRNVGPTPLKAKGTVDQHSLLQLFQAGPSDKWYLFVSPKKFTSDFKVPGKPFTFQKLMLTEKEGVQKAFRSAQKPYAELTFEKIDAENFGELLQLLELEVAFLGKLYGVNFWNQPAVEFSKSYTKTMLRNL